MHLAEHAAVYLIISMAVSVAAVVLAVVLLLRWRAAIKPLSRLSADETNPSELLHAVLRATEETESKLDRLRSSVEAHVQESRAFIRHVSIVRYDAFEDIAGYRKEAF